MNLVWTFVVAVWSVRTFWYRDASAASPSVCLLSHMFCQLNRSLVLVSPAAERLRNILGEDDGAPTPTIFTEMDTLQRDGDELEWKESAR